MVSGVWNTESNATKISIVVTCMLEINIDWSSCIFLVM